MVKKWPNNRECARSKKSIKHPDLVEPSKILLFPLYFKIDLMKDVRVMNKDGEGCAYLKEKLPYLNETKIKKGTFVGPQILKALKDCGFKEKMIPAEMSSWDASEIVGELLGEHASQQL